MVFYYFHILYSTVINKIFLTKQKTQYLFQFEFDRFSKRQLELNLINNK